MDSQRRRRWRLKCALRNHPTRNQWFGSSTLLARIAAASPSQRLASGLLSRLVSSAFCFRRQMPFGTRFIADFCAPSIKLMVEVDGGYRSGRNRRSVPSGLERAAAGCGVPKCLVASFRPALTMPPSAISSLERKAELYCAQAQALGLTRAKRCCRCSHATAVRAGVRSQRWLVRGKPGRLLKFRPLMGPLGAHRLAAGSTGCRYR